MFLVNYDIDGLILHYLFKDEFNFEIINRLYITFNKSKYKAFIERTKEYYF